MHGKRRPSPGGDGRRLHSIAKGPALLRCDPDVRGPGALRIFLDLELHAIAPLQGAEPIHLDGGVVDEDVLAAVVGADESEPLVVLEELHCTGLSWHDPSAMDGTASAPARRPVRRRSGLLAKRTFSQGAFPSRVS